MWKLVLLLPLLVSLPASALTNPNRAYPPSCLDYPLPTSPSGPSQFVEFTAIGANSGTSEPARAIFWRKACSSGNSAFLVTIQRIIPADEVIQIPQPFVSQTGAEIPARFVVEPNTRAESHILQADPLRTYVLEFGPTGSTFDLDQGFNLRAFYGSNLVLAGFINPYQASAYPEASQPLVIGGRMSGSWYETAHPGEGIFLEIGESGSQTVLFFAWFTYDTNGRPYWLVGQAGVNPGVRSITVPVQYFHDGGFAGNFTAAIGEPWGNVTMTFPTCNSITLQYQSGTLPGDIPGGSGTRNWSRLLNIEGYACE